MQPIRFYFLSDDPGGTVIRLRRPYASKAEEENAMQICFEEIERVLRENERVVYRWTGHVMMYQNEHGRFYHHAAFVYTDWRLIFSCQFRSSNRLYMFCMSNLTDYSNFSDDDFVIPEMAIDFEFESIYFLYDRTDPDRIIWNLCKELNALLK